MQTRSYHRTRTFHVTYRDREGAIQTTRTSGTGATPAQRRADAIRNVKGRHPGAREVSAVGVRVSRPLDTDHAHRLFDSLNPHAAAGVDAHVRADTPELSRAEQDAMIAFVRSLDPENLGVAA